MIETYIAASHMHRVIDVEHKVEDIVLSAASRAPSWLSKFATILVILFVLLFIWGVGGQLFSERPEKAIKPLGVLFVTGFLIYAKLSR